MKGRVGASQPILSTHPPTISPVPTQQPKIKRRTLIPGSFSRSASVANGGAVDSFFPRFRSMRMPPAPARRACCTEEAASRVWEAEGGNWTRGLGGTNPCTMVILHARSSAPVAAAAAAAVVNAAGARIVVESIDRRVCTPANACLLDQQGIGRWLLAALRGGVAPISIHSPRPPLYPTRLSIDLGVNV